MDGWLPSGEMFVSGDPMDFWYGEKVKRAKKAQEDAHGRFFQRCGIVPVAVERKVSVVWARFPLDR